MQQLYHGEPPSRANDMPPRSWLKAVGPMGWLAGRSTQLLAVGLVWTSSCPKVMARLVLTEFTSVLGLHLIYLCLNLCPNIFYNFMSGQSVLATCILAQKYILHISKGEVWFKGLFG